MALKRYLIQDNVIAYNAWQQSLHKNGWPKNTDGTSMDVVELYNYWLCEVDKRTFLHYARRMRQKLFKHK